MFRGNANLLIGVLPRAQSGDWRSQVCPAQFVPLCSEIVKPSRLGHVAMTHSLSTEAACLGMTKCFEILSFRKLPREWKFMFNERNHFLRIANRRSRPISIRSQIVRPNRESPFKQNHEHQHIVTSHQSLFTTAVAWLSRSIFRHRSGSRFPPER